MKTLEAVQLTFPCPVRWLPQVWGCAESPWYALRKCPGLAEMLWCLMANVVSEMFDALPENDQNTQSLRKEIHTLVERFICQNFKLMQTRLRSIKVISKYIK